MKDRILGGGAKPERVQLKTHFKIRRAANHFHSLVLCYIHLFYFILICFQLLSG